MFFYMDFEREPKAHQNYNCNSKSRWDSHRFLWKTVWSILYIHPSRPWDNWESTDDNAAFVAQSCADIQWKLQELERFTGMNATQLLEVANKVFVNRDCEAQWEAD